MTATRAGVELESVEYQRDTETYRGRYDQETTSPSMAVVAVLSEVMNTDPLELDPLHYTVDTDALDAFVRVRSTADGHAHISFAFDEYAVTVSGNGEIAVAPSRAGRTDHRNEDISHR